MRKSFLPLAALLLAACTTEKPMQYDASVTPYLDGKQCAISFTYDDGMLCHYTDIAPELEKRGFRGTFWIIGANMGRDDAGYPWMTWDQVADLARRGHEIANHTWNHPSLPALPIDSVAQELTLCDDKIEAVTGQRPITMAYPYNAMSPEVVAKCEEGRVGTRTVWVGHGQKESHTTPDSMRLWLRGLLDAGEWGVTMTHGTTYGWDMWDRPEDLYEFFDEVKAQQDSVWVATFAQVAAYLKERQAATVQVEGTTHSLKLTVRHSLDAALFDQPLTIAVKGADWSEVGAFQMSAGVLNVDNRGTELLVTLQPGDEPIELKW